MKQTANQIRERTRNEVAKQFSVKIKALQDTIKQKNAYIAELERRYRETSAELSELKSKHDMQEDWIERMQDFCNMSDADRKEFIEQQRTKQRLNDNLSAISDICKALVMY